MRQVRAELTHDIGGNPTAVQRALIERAAWLSLRLAQLDHKIAAGGTDFTQVDSAVYLGWHNSYCRTVARLGITTKQNGTKPSLESILAKGRAP
jgi:hypothetical protein